MTQSEERRQDERLPFDVAVEIRSSERTVCATAKDVSQFGFFARSAELFPVGTVCEIEMVLALDNQEKALIDRFEVVRLEEGQGMGFRFIEVDED